MLWKMLCMTGLLLYSQLSLAVCNDKNRAQKNLLEFCEYFIQGRSALDGLPFNKSDSAKWCACALRDVDWKVVVNDDCSSDASSSAFYGHSERDAVIARCGKRPDKVSLSQQPAHTFIIDYERKTRSDCMTEHIDIQSVDKNYSGCKVFSSTKSMKVFYDCPHAKNSWFPPWSGNLPHRKSRK